MLHHRPVQHRPCKPERQPSQDAQQRLLSLLACWERVILQKCREQGRRTEIWPSWVPAALLMTMDRMRVGMRSS